MDSFGALRLIPTVVVINLAISHEHGCLRASDDWCSAIGQFIW